MNVTNGSRQNDQIMLDIDMLYLVGQCSEQDSSTNDLQTNISCSLFEEDADTMSGQVLVYKGKNERDYGIYRQ